MGKRKRRTPSVTTPSISESELTINDLSEDILKNVFRFLEEEQRLTFWRVNRTFCRSVQSYWYSVKYVVSLKKYGVESDKNYLKKVLLCPKLKKFHFNYFYHVIPGTKKTEDGISRGYGALLAKKCPNIEEVYIKMYSDGSDWLMRIYESVETSKNFRYSNLLKMLRGYFSVVKMNNKIINLQLKCMGYEPPLEKIINILAEYVKLQYLRVVTSPYEVGLYFPPTLAPNLRTLAQNVTSLDIESCYEKCWSDRTFLKIEFGLSSSGSKKIVDRNLQLTTLDVSISNMQGIFTDLHKLLIVGEAFPDIGGGWRNPYVQIYMVGFDEWLMRHGQKLKLLKISFHLDHLPDQKMEDSFITDICQYCSNLEVLKLYYPRGAERSDGHVMESLRNLKQLKDLLIVLDGNVYTVTRNNLFLLLDDLKHLEIIGIVLNSNGAISLKFKKYLEEYLDRHVDRHIRIEDDLDL